MKRLFQGSVPTSAGTAEYIVPTGYKAEVNDICLSNTTTGSLTCTLYLVPSGGTPDATNQLIPGSSISGNTILQWTGNQVLNTGDTIQIVASGSGIVANITGDEYRA